MAELDTSPAPWLQRAWSPRETFDPTPWLQERYRRQVEQAKLPLELQGMALQNQQAQLAIEHQGMQNDITNLQLQQRKDQMPLVNDWLKSIATKPLQEQLNDPGPTVTDPQLQQTITNYKERVANTLIGQGLKQKILGQKIAVANIIEAGGTPPPPDANGFYDEGALADAKTAALEAKSKREISERVAGITAEEQAKLDFAQKNLPTEISLETAKAEAKAKAAAKYEKDPTLKLATDLADIQAQLRASEQKTMGMKDTAEINAELENQKRLRDTIATVQSKLGGKDSAIEIQQRLVKEANDAVSEAVKSGAPQDEVNQKIAERNSLEAKVYPKGTQIQGVNPATGKLETRIAGGTTPEQDAVTAKVKSELQEKINGSVQAARTLHELSGNVDWWTVGPLAWSAEKLGRYGPGSVLGITGSMGAPGRAEIRNAKIDVMRDLEVRGHASPTILKAVAEGLPSLGLFETPSTAIAAVNERKRSIIVEGLTAAHQLGVKPPGELISLLSTYPSTKIKEMVKSGSVSPDDATEAFDLQLKKKPTSPSKTPLADWVH